MIKIDRDRVDCPPSLNTSNKTLRENDYKQVDVRDALLDMQYFKCCYCERYLPSLGRTAKWIEHFIARDDDSLKDAHGNTNWNKANAWENLLFSCSTCNRSKGTTPPFDLNGKRKLIDPSYCRIDPERHVEFCIDGVAISYKSRTRLGKNTIKVLKFKERRNVHSGLRNAQRDIDNYFSKLVDVLVDGNKHMVNSILIDLKRMTSAHRPHASFCRKYIIQQINEFNANGLQNLNQIHGTHILPIKVDVAKGYEVIP